MCVCVCVCVCVFWGDFVGVGVRVGVLACTRVCVSVLMHHV